MTAQEKEHEAMMNIATVLGGIYVFPRLVVYSALRSLARGWVCMVLYNWYVPALWEWETIPLHGGIFLALLADLLTHSFNHPLPKDTPIERKARVAASVLFPLCILFIGWVIRAIWL